MSLSTHVLNTTTGLPAAGLAFALFSAVSNAASDSTSDTAPAIETGTTDADGRYRFTTPLDPGTYRIRFSTADYFDGAATLYPYVDITFTISDERGGAHGHLHIPLLLSPYGYSTYQGS